MDKVYLNLPYLHRELNYLALLDYGLKFKLPVDDIRSSKMKLYYEIISSYYKMYPELRDYLIAESLVKNLKRSGNTPDIEDVVNFFLKEVKDSSLYHQVLRRYSLTKKNNTKGVPFYNFALENPQGKTVKLSDLRGKFVFIDFYFTGCGPCRLLVPTLKMMEEKYKGRNIVFVSISVDKTKKEWNGGRGVYSSPTAIQLYTNGLGNKHPLILHAGVSSYPTMFLIDEVGKIIDGNFSYLPKEISSRIEKALAEKSK